MSILAPLAIGAGAGIAQGAIQTGFGFLGSAQQQDYYRENQKKAFAMAQNEEKLRAKNAVAGLKLAGLSPALASDGKFSAGSAPSSPLGSMSMPNLDIANASLSIAEAKKAEAEAESINIKNNQEKNADELSQYFGDVYFTKLIDSAHSPAEKKVYEEMASLAKTKGAFGLFEHYLDILDKKELYDMDYHEYKLRKHVAFWQNANSDTFLDIAKVPTRNRELLEKTIQKYGAEVEKLKKDTSLTEEEKNLRLAQITLTNEEIENLREVTKNLKNTNIMKMIDDGEYGKAFIATILMLFGQISASKRF